jgi:hypothetical protein
MSEGGPPGQDIAEIGGPPGQDVAEGPAPRGPAAAPSGTWPQIDGVSDFTFGIGPRDGRLYKWGSRNRPALCTGIQLLDEERIVSIAVCGDSVTQYVAVVTTNGRAYSLVFSFESVEVEHQSDMRAPYPGLPLMTGVTVSKGFWGIMLGNEGRPYRFSVFGHERTVQITNIENVEAVDVQQNEAVFLQRDGTVSVKYHNGRGEFVPMAVGFPTCQTISAGYERISGAVTYDNRAILFTGHPPWLEFVDDSARSLLVGEHHQVILHLDGSVSVCGRMSTIELPVHIRERVIEAGIMPPDGAEEVVEFENYERVINLLPRHNIMQVAIVEDRTYFLQSNGEILVGEKGIAIAFYDERDFRRIRFE